MSKSSLFLIALFDDTSLRQDSLLSSPSSAVSRLLHSHCRSSGVCRKPAHHDMYAIRYNVMYKYNVQVHMYELKLLQVGSCKHSHKVN